LYRTLLLNKKGYETLRDSETRVQPNTQKNENSKVRTRMWYKYIRENIAYFTRSFF